MRVRPTRPSPALVVAVVALIVAMGGTGYAAVKLPRNSVGSTQLRTNAVTSSKVKDGSLAARDFATGQLPAGPQGQQGVQGPAGAAGTKGEKGDPGTNGQQGPPGSTPGDGVGKIYGSPPALSSSSVSPYVDLASIHDGGGDHSLTTTVASRIQASAVMVLKQPASGAAAGQGRCYMDLLAPDGNLLTIMGATAGVDFSVPATNGYYLDVPLTASSPVEPAGTYNVSVRCGVFPGTAPTMTSASLTAVAVGS